MKFEVGDKVVFKFSSEMPPDFKEFEGKVLTIDKIDSSDFPYKTKEHRGKYNKPLLFAESELEFADKMPLLSIEAESKKF